ncbi:hypothetical protein SARC_12479 [Sphaeroforma arctica JP610]|uniref:RGS domain-containing protein n=1 Tax=Sphaeroforma arctica JP610 TaxID=667725 RepID=A0A0L0FG15_9EUKA|nr:hypothetical protein SARC_12479 [Sphaeroforma arctica JP610]KNC74988.1 hypothetical protein SARC_12479 [Sphaeroforma arctica JP610]|eukprot:XP_014148890.1 hypothetical protein SARC_12479 [Sphaeroforma arctica JP610]
MNLHTRLEQESGYNSSQLVYRFGEGLSQAFVDKMYDKNMTEADVYNRTAHALGALSSELPVDTAVDRLGLAAMAVKFASQGNESVALDRMANIVVGFAETLYNDSSALVTLVETEMAKLASFETDRDEAAAILPAALGTAYFNAIGMDAMDIVVQVSGAFIDESRARALDKIFLLSWTSFAAVEIVVMILVAMVYWVRNSPEVRSRHKIFTWHLLSGALIIPLVGIFFVAIPCFQISYDPGLNGQLLLTATSLMAFFAVMFLLVPMVNRQRFMYLVFTVRQFRYRSYYWIMLPWHLFLVAIIIAGHLWCYWDVDNCSVYYDYVFITFSVWAIVLEFMFYTVMLYRNEQTALIFVDWWQAARLVSLWGITYILGYGYTGWRNSKMLSAFWISWQLVILSLGGVLDYFLLLTLKAIARDYDYKFLDTLNLAGNANQVINMENVSFVISDYETRQLLIKFAEKEHCAEMPQFLCDIRVLLKRLDEKRTGTEADHRDRDVDFEVRSLIQKYIFPRLLNVPGYVQIKLESQLAELYGITFKKASPSTDTLDFSAPAEVPIGPQPIEFPDDMSHKNTDWNEVLEWFEPTAEHVRSLVRMNLIPRFRISPEVIQLLENRQVRVEAMEKGGMISKGDTSEGVFTRGTRTGRMTSDASVRVTSGAFGARLDVNGKGKLNSEVLMEGEESVIMTGGNRTEEPTVDRVESNMESDVDDVVVVMLDGEEDSSEMESDSLGFQVDFQRCE